MALQFSTRAKEDLMQAVQLLDQAVARDPLFFLAYGELAGAHDRIYFLGFDHTEARLKLSETALQTIRRCSRSLAKHIWPSLSISTGPIRIMIGHVRSWLSPAARCLTNHEFLFLPAILIAGRVSWEKSLEEMKQALELDPRNFSILQQISAYLRSFAPLQGDGRDPGSRAGDSSERYSQSGKARFG